MKDPDLMVAAIAFVSDVPYPIEIKRGLTLLETDPVVEAHRKYFVPQSAGNQALIRRAGEIERAMEQFRDKQKAEQRAARIAQGAKFDPSDDATAESLKRQVRNDDSLELVHDASGFVIGARTKPALVEAARQRMEKAAKNGESVAAQRIAEMQRAREA